jgi:hypothetical protein
MYEQIFKKILALFYYIIFFSVNYEFLIHVVVVVVVFSSVLFCSHTYSHVHCNHDLLSLFSLLPSVFLSLLFDIFRVIPIILSIFFYISVFLLFVITFCYIYSFCFLVFIKRNIYFFFNSCFLGSFYFFTVLCYVLV